MLLEHRKPIPVELKFEDIPVGTVYTVVGTKDVYLKISPCPMEVTGEDGNHLVANSVNLADYSLTICGDSYPVIDLNGIITVD